MVETVAAAGWPGRMLVAAVAAVGEAEVIRRLYLVSVPAVAMPDLLIDTVESTSRIAEVEASGQLAVDRSAFSEGAQRAHCLEDLGCLTFSVDHEEVEVELTHSQVQSLVALSRREERWVVLRDSHLRESDEE